jgi:hypothetical protein
MSDEAPNWDKLAEMDPILEMMQHAGVPLTREHYIEAKYGAPGTMDHPEQWTQEHEDDLPHPFQRR